VTTKRVVASAALIVPIIGVVVAATWLNSLFEEPDAEEISSLAGHLGALSVLGVFAHPDDEILAAGALAEAASSSNSVARMITATRGEAGIPDDSVCRPEDLGIVRHAEVLKHGYQLGLTGQQVWRHPDGKLDALIEPIALELVREIRSLRPDLIITFDPESGYTFHPDHRAIGSATSKARRLAADPAFRPDLGAPHGVRWLAFVLVPRRVMETFGGERGATVAEHQVSARYAVPIDPSIKTRAWSIHESQSDYMRRVWRVPLWVLYRFFDKEHYAIDESGDV
jgi:LmbE family N-acetylglucosaminyl deacetylase